MAESPIHEPPLRYASIKEWPEDERPREKLVKHGASSLSDSELLAILINTGSGKQSAVDLARKLLQEYKSLRTLSGLSVGDLKQRKFKGIGKVKAIVLAAAFEIARRLASTSKEERTPIRTPEDVAKRYIAELRDLKQEVFMVVCLSSSNRIIQERTITKGLLNSSLTHPREVFREAILENAASVILLHNHPSGNLEPSREDIQITKQLVEAGKIIGISVQDHIIIGGDNFTSMMERGLM
ncbi:MAG: DNA repair protein RadC [Ignavibacteriales bacterium]|nr:DNA repair protein RadC [Ignavibacteriales bacterium]